ncbi:hypothetical protein OPV22_021068 [Ensete ventricosum]|uniref:Auxin-responsive protein n=1 Tax=Ensete ventricosum TaxID=4639 RepID=A0AAV8QG03_ENSVE|nr:hypothetical protein OPV22_021068 [Ensete ventricosum]
MVNGFELHDEAPKRRCVPGHIVAYEDMEDDLLLVGDLNSTDFVRVAKRIRMKKSEDIHVLLSQIKQEYHLISVEDPLLFKFREA